MQHARHAMKAPLIGILVALTLTGCQTTGLLNTPPGSKPTTGATNGTLSPLRLGSLQFRPASAETMAKMSQQASGAPAPMAAEATRAGDAAGGAGATSMVARPAVMPSPYSFGTYFGGPFGQMKLDGVQEAKTAGASAGFLDLQHQVIAPAIAEWASDARLVSSNGTLDAEGNTIAASGSFPEEFAWHATYSSASRSEVLEFHVTAQETRVVRLKWSPLSLDVSAVKVDAKAAVATLTQAVASRLKSKEEELGRDYFFDANQPMIGGDARVGIAVPAIAVGEPAPGIDYQGPTTETLYQLKAGGRWHVNLQAIGDHLVWELNYNAYTATEANAGVAVSADAPVSSPATEPAKVDAEPYQPQPWVDENAYGMIDARTGEVIRLRRPTKYTYPAVSRTEPGMPKPEVR